MLTLAEQYRPKQFAEVVGQDRAVRQIDTVGKRGFSGRAWWLAGASGTGKTTLARLIAGEVAEDSCVIELDAGDITPASLREVEAALLTFGFPPKGGRAYIINEAHGLRRDSVRQLLVLLERLPNHSTIIFTTTAAGEQMLFEDLADANPLLSRCVRIRLETLDLVDPFAKHARKIAKKEGLDGHPLAVYRDLAQRHECNMRAMLQEIETGELAYNPKTAAKTAPEAEIGSGPHCGHCAKPVTHRKKYCNVDCYMAHLKAQKRRR